MSPSTARRKGFTLLEIVVAFTILAVALVALLQLFSTGLGGIGRAEEEARAALLARSLLDRVGTEFALDPGEIRGTDEDGRAWSVVVRPFIPENVDKPETLPVELMQVVATVASARGAPFVLDTLRLRPRPAPGAAR